MTLFYRCVCVVSVGSSMQEIWRLCNGGDWSREISDSGVFVSNATDQLLSDDVCCRWNIVRSLVES